MTVGPILGRAELGDEVEETNGGDSSGIAGIRDGREWVVFDTEIVGQGEREVFD